MGNHPTPLVSPTEKYLVERAERFSEPIPSMLVWIAGAVVQLPQELALQLIRRRKASAIADPSAVASLTLTEDDIDDELEAKLFGARAA